ncbi:hypothetical protein D3C71_1191280 [compost metagenome]
MRWIEFQQLDGKRHPAWKRTLGVSEETGEVFVPAAMAGEQNVLLCAAYDGTTVASNHGHVYVPASWLSREFPATKDLCELMVIRGRQAMGSE